MSVDIRWAVAALLAGHARLVEMYNAELDRAEKAEKERDALEMRTDLLGVETANRMSGHTLEERLEAEAKTAEQGKRAAVLDPQDIHHILARALHEEGIEHENARLRDLVHLTYDLVAEAVGKPQYDFTTRCKSAIKLAREALGDRP